MSLLSKCSRAFKTSIFVSILPPVFRNNRISQRSITKLNGYDQQNQLRCISTSHIHKAKESLEMPSESVVDYEYVKKAINQKTNLIIDVREPEELVKFGKIPSSINIPLGTVTSALSLPDEEFKKIYNTDKPSKSSELIFYCMIGKRSESAQMDAINLGFKNSKNYLGSFKDWDSKQKK